MIIACPWELPPPEVRALLPDCSFAAMEPQLDQPVFVLAANRWGLQKALELRMRRCPACRGALLWADRKRPARTPVRRGPERAGHVAARSARTLSGTRTSG